MSDLSNASRDDLIKAVYSGFRKAGLSHEASLVMVGEVGRENGYQARYIFGNHSDPHNKVTNSGMISWQGSRRNNLLAALSRDGVMTGNTINQTQEAIDSQARFLVSEMKVHSPKVYSYLTSGNVDSKTGMDLVGKEFIRWRIDDPEYRQKGLNNRSYFYNLGKSLVDGGASPPALPFLEGRANNAAGSASAYNLNTVSAKIDMDGAFMAASSARAQSDKDAQDLYIQNRRKELNFQYGYTPSAQVFANGNLLVSSGDNSAYSNAAKENARHLASVKADRDDILGTGFGASFGAQFGDIQDRYNEGWFGNLMNGRSLVERVDPNWTQENKNAMREHFKRVNGVDMPEESWGRLNESKNKDQASRIYDGAYRTLIGQETMQRSGTATNLAAGLAVGLLTPQELPANLAGGWAVKGLASAARTARMGSTIAKVSQAATATEIRKTAVDILVSGAASSAMRASVDSQYTMADAGFDLLTAGAFAGGLRGASRALRGGWNNGVNALERYSNEHLDGVSRELGEANHARTEVGTAAKIELSENIARRMEAGENLASATDNAHADLYGATPRSRGPVDVAVMPDEVSSSALRQDLSLASRLISSVKFTKEVLSNLTKEAQDKISNALKLGETIETRAGKMAEQASVTHTNRISSAKQQLEVSQQHLESRKQAEAEAKADYDRTISEGDELIKARRQEIEGKSQEKLQKAERQLLEQQNSVKNRQAEALKVRALNAADLRSGNPKVAAKAKAKVDKAISRYEKAVARAANLENSVNDLRASHAETLKKSRDGAEAAAQRVRDKATDKLQAAIANRENAETIYKSRQDELNNLAGTSPRTREDFINELSANRQDQIAPNLDLETLAEIQQALDSTSVYQLAKELGVEDYLVGNNLVDAIKLKHSDKYSKDTLKLLKEKDAELKRTPRGQIADWILGQLDRIGLRVTPTQRILFNDKSEFSQVWARTMLEDPYGARGMTAAMHFSMNMGSYTTHVNATEAAAFADFGKNLGVVVANTKPKIDAFRRLESQLVEERLSGMTNEQIRAKRPDDFSPAMEAHVDTLIDTMRKMANDRWRAQGRTGEAPMPKELPVRWDHDKLAAMLSNRQDRDAFRQAMVDSIMNTQREIIAAGGKIDMVTEQNIRVIADGLVRGILKSSDGSGRGYISLNTRGFNLHRSALEMVNDGTLSLNEVDTSTMRKLGKLYEAGQRVNKDLDVKFTLSSGETVSIRDFTSPGVSDAIRSTARYNAGYVALKSAGFDIEEPGSVNLAMELMDRQGASDMAKKAFQSSITQFTGKRFDWQSNPSHITDLTTSMARGNMLGGLVFSQFSETGQIAGHYGVANAVRFVGSIPGLANNAKKKARGEAVDDMISDIEKYSGLIGVENYQNRSFIDINESITPIAMGPSGNKALDLALAGARTVEHVQGTITGYRAINAAQRQFTAMAATQDIAEVVQAAKRGNFTIPKQLRSAGLTEDMVRSLAKADGNPNAPVFVYKDGEFKGTALDNLGDDMEALKVAAVVRRSTGQVIQEQFIGESGLYVHSNVHKFLYMFRGYMLGSIGKQMVRQWHDLGPARALSNMVVGTAFAASVAYLRALLKASTIDDEKKKKEFMEKQSSLFQLTTNGLQYASQTGPIQEVFNLFGIFSDKFESSTRMGSQSGWDALAPGLSYLNKPLQAGIAAGRAVTSKAGLSEQRDSAAAKAVSALMPFQNTWYYQATLGRLARKWEAEDKAQEKRDKRKERLQHIDPYMM